MPPGYTLLLRILSRQVPTPISCTHVPWRRLCLGIWCRWTSWRTAWPGGKERFGLMLWGRGQDFRPHPKSAGTGRRRKTAQSHDASFLHAQQWSEGLYDRLMGEARATLHSLTPRTSSPPRATAALSRHL